MLEPVKLVDGLVRGLILATYDFLLLTLCGLAIPFVRGTHRFWPYVNALTKRISSLTFLFLWIGIAAIFYLDRSDLAKMVLTARAPNTMVIISTFALTVFIDLLIRLSCWPLRSAVRQRLYQSLLRVAAGVIFFGTVFALVFQFRVDLQGLLSSIKIYWVVGIFVLPLAVVTAKLLPSKGVPSVLIMGALFFVLIPNFVMRVGTLTAFVAYDITQASSLPPPPMPDPPAVVAYDSQCTFVGDQLNATGYLTTGKDFFSLEPRDLHIWGTDEFALEVDLGRPMEAAPRLALTPKTYVPIAVTTRPAAESRAKIRADGPFDCFLTIHKRGPRERAVEQALEE